MEFKDIELINMVCENSEDAKDALYEKYGYIVNIVLNKYKRTMYALGIDYNEIKQEALLGFSDALVAYQGDLETSLPTFITLCTERKVMNYIRKENTKKKKLEKNCISLEQDEKGDINILDFIGDKKYEPLDIIEKTEDYQLLKQKINGILSPAEKDVYNLMIKGYHYTDIAKILNKEIKQIDNTIQRIRRKIKDIIE